MRTPAEALYVFSIGLNVGAVESVNQLGDTLSAARAIVGAPFAVGMVRGEWEGIPERTLHYASGFTLADAPIVRRRAAQLAQALRQDAVAVLALGSKVWEVIGADGAHLGYGSVAEYPLAPGIAEEQ